VITLTTGGGNLPAQLIIPRLDLTAPIIPLGINEQGEFAAPASGAQVGWYLGSGTPGISNAADVILLDGHLTDKQGQPAIFANLHQLRVNDQLSIKRADDKIFSYVVTEVNNQAVEQIDMTQLMISSAADKQAVSIITCAGDFNPETQTYTQRLIVRAVATMLR
jgi:LPXTG-site transpeptidase (sortase) family protein